MKQVITALGLMVALVMSATVSATPADNLKRLLGGIESLQGHFDQMVLDNSGTRLQQSSGDMALQRPGLFRWRTDEPFPQLLVADGQYLWLYDEDLEQVTRQDLDKRLDSTPALLLSGDLSQLEHTFAIVGPEQGGDGVYRLKPIDPNAMFSVMRIAFTAGVPQEIQLEDNLGQRTSVAFTQLDVNPELEAGRFRFIPPQGADLIIE
ncbi:outer membrane lipoprotein chaperone LolA [Motiliproteus sediminis]|uniref:outer membrane lipoprotein chaperone LolA n=1 Tax=Motiliproteus sediminis TaxID=1468178 RepID=UPI001AEFB19B|nr:outer membrane lipoprotein chaperone LolA [Motiliproteus sediminis]